MIVITLTHGLFGEELLRAAEMIVGKQDKVEVLSIQGNVSMNEASLKLEEIIKKYPDDGCLVFTDMFGGSPSNIAIAYLDYENLEVVSGLNLAMLLKTFTMRMDSENSLEDVARQAAQAGIESIKVAGDLLKKKED